MRFDATNSVSSWNLLNLRDGGILLYNWMVADFGIDARPDYSEGWNWSTDGGGERLLISGFGVATSTPAFSNASSLPGAYCPGTGAWNPKTGSCSGGTVNVNTLGIQAEYTSPVISAVPVPATAWLVGLGLSLIGFARYNKA